MITFVAGMALLGSGLVGCTSEGSDETGFASNGTFTLAIAADPGNLDPNQATSVVTRLVDRFLYSSLINVAVDGDIEPGLAERWRASTTTATFTLRDGITCADGTELSASTVANNINYIGDSNNQSPLLGFKVMPGTTAKADDAARTVTVRSGAPDAFLLRNIGTVGISCGNAERDQEALARGENGTGLYTLSEATPNDQYTLTRRDDFGWGPAGWDKDEVGIPERVVIRVIPNETTAANLLLSGEVNAATILGPDQERLKQAGLFHAGYSGMYGEFFFNQSAGHPGQDEAVRRALVQALDLRELGKVLTSGTGEPTTQVANIPPIACPGDTVSGNLPSYDVEAANDALDAAGWTESADSVRTKNGSALSLDLIYPTDLGSTGAATAELVQESLEAVGVSVDIRALDSAGFNRAWLTTGEWDMSMGPLGQQLPSQLVPYVSGQTPPNGSNFSNVRNPEYDRLVKQAAKLPGSKGCQDWNDAEAALVKAVDVAPFVDNEITMFGNGVEFEVDGALDPYSVRMLNG